MVVPSLGRSMMFGHLAEFGSFHMKGATIEEHTHDVGHYTILLCGSIEATFRNGAKKVLTEPMSWVYFPAGEKHSVVGLQDFTITAQFHDAPSQP